MVSILTQFGDSSSGLGALGLNGSSFLIQLVTFIIALLILRKWAFKPIMKVMNERRDLIESGVKMGEELRQEKTKLEEAVEKTMHEARLKADEIIAGAQESAREVIKEAEEKAQAKTDISLKDAESRIIQETARARAKLEQEIVGLVSDVTEAIIDVKVDAKKDASLVDKAIKEAKA